MLSLCLVAAMSMSAFSPISAGAYAADGSYTGTGQGKNGDITVAVDISEEKIQNVTVLSQNETPSFWEQAAVILPQFIGKSSANEVDSVTGATLSSEGIKAAVNAAVAKASDVILGSGTASDPYVISSAAQLRTFAQKVDEGDTAYTTSYAVMGADIDLSGIESWDPIGAEGKASSNKTKLFAGSFDGRGRTVSGMKITGTYDSEANLGLFSTLGGTARVSNIVLTDVDISAEESGSWANIRAGGIAGDTQSASPRAAIVDGCCVSGSVKLSASDGSAFAGGILGRAFSRSAVINCTVDADISAVTSGSYNGAYAGGIAGSNGANVVTANCAVFGTVSATNTSGAADSYAGGITGMLSGKLYNCYADAEASITQKAGVSKQFVGALAGQNMGTAGSGNYFSSNAVITAFDDKGGSTAVEARAWSSDDKYGSAEAEDPIAPEELSGEAFANTLNSNIKAVNEALNESALALREWTAENGAVVPSDEVWVPSEIDSAIFAGGTGEAEDPYLIADKEQLKAFASSLNSKIDYSGKYVKLAEDIDISGETWSPIGGSFYRFNGDFDGDGKAVTGLTVGSEETPLVLDGSSAYVGLFGQIGEHARIRNVALNNVAVYTHSSGSAYVGGIAGRMSGTDTEGDLHGAVIDGASVSGVISHTTDKGTSFIGGVVGHMFKGAVINSMTDVSLTAKELSGELAEVGGIVGLLNRGAVATLMMKRYPARSSRRFSAIRRTMKLPTPPCLWAAARRATRIG